jgi:hypothetical protein
MSSQSLASNTASQVTVTNLSLSELSELIEQATARALARQSEEYLGPADAARFIYGRNDRAEAFRKLRDRYPEIDALSIGTGRFRRWRRADLESFIAKKPIRGQASESRDSADADG